MPTVSIVQDVATQVFLSPIVRPALVSLPKQIELTSQETQVKTENNPQDTADLEELSQAPIPADRASVIEAHHNRSTFVSFHFEQVNAI